VTKDPAILLKHILECIGWLEGYASGGEGSLLRDHKTQSAALRDLQTLGESVKQLPTSLTEVHPEVDWRGIVGVRNILVHDYLGVNVQLVADMIRRDLPLLKQAVADLLNRTQG
jgi:uncharacterized protein with HEPN domain